MRDTDTDNKKNEQKQRKHTLWFLLFEYHSCSSSNMDANANEERSHYIISNETHPVSSIAMLRTKDIQTEATGQLLAEQRRGSSQQQIHGDDLARMQNCVIGVRLRKIQIGGAAAVLNRTLGIGMCVRLVLLSRLLLQHVVLCTRPEYTGRLSRWSL